MMVKSKTNLRLFLLVGAALLVSTGPLFAQSTGDYRSAATGNWSAVSTWQTYNGTSWVAASTIPPNTANITISAGNTVTVDIADFKAKGTMTVKNGATLDMGYSVLGGNAGFTVDSGAVLVTENAGGLDSTLQTTGTVTLSHGAKYVFNGTSAQMTGSKLPDTLQTLVVDNAAGVALSHSVDVSDSLIFVSGSLMLDTNYVVAGAVRGASSTSYAVTDSAVSYLKIPNIGSTSTLFPVGTTIEGYSPVWIANSGTADAFSVSAVADSSAVVGLGRVNVEWNIAEDHPGSADCTLKFGWMGIAENAAFSSYAQAFSFIYNLSGATYVQAGSGPYTGVYIAQPYTLSRSGITTLGTFGIGKFGFNFAVQVGDYGSVKSGNWDSLSIWKQWNGTGWSTTPSAVPDGIVSVFINTGDTVTVTSTTTADGNLVVNGYLKDEFGMYTSAASAVVDSTGTFELAHDGGAVAGIPTAIWKTGSTCLITGKNDTVTSTTNFNTSQDFYNLIIDATFESSKDLGMYNNTIDGKFVLNSNSSSQVRLTSPKAGSPNTITFKGPIYVEKGEFTSNGSGSAADITINDYGNIFVTGGGFSISRGSGPTVDWNFYGDTLSIANAETKTSGSADEFVFAKQDTQYVVLKNASYGGGGIPIVVGSGATLDMGTNSLGGDGMFATDSGATLISRDTTGLDGNLQSSVKTALGSQATYVFGGAVAQTTGMTMPSAVGNLTISNSQGVTLSHNLTVTKTLTFRSGKLLLDTCNVTAGAVTGGSATNFVETDSSRSYLGIPNVAYQTVMFPVGTGAEGYSPVSITNSGTSDTYTVNAAKDTNRTAEVGRVDVKWNIGEGTPGGSNLTLQFGWMASAENSAFASNRMADARIYMDTAQVGSGSYTTQFSTQPYTVSQSGIDTVGTFIVGGFTLTGIDQANNVPAVFRLYQNYPNPFNPSTRIEFSVAKKGMTTIAIYNVLGQLVKTLVDKVESPGNYKVTFDAAGLASGVYFYRLQSGSYSKTMKLMLLK